MPGAISVAGSFAPPWRTTIFRGAAADDDGVRDGRLATPLLVSALEVGALGEPGLLESALAGSVFAESGCVESGPVSGFVELDFSESVFGESVVAESGAVLPSVLGSGAFCPASLSGAFASAGAPVSGAEAAGGGAGACSEAFAEPVTSCTRELSPQDRRLSPSASVMVKANRMTGNCKIVPHPCQEGKRATLAYKKSAQEKTGEHLPLPG